VIAWAIVLEVLEKKCRSNSEFYTRQTCRLGYITLVECDYAPKIPSAARQHLRQFLITREREVKFARLTGSRGARGASAVGGSGSASKIRPHVRIYLKITAGVLLIRIFVTKFPVFFSNFVLKISFRFCRFFPGLFAAF